MLGLREESEPAFASAVIMLILASIAVGLRLLTKKWTKLGYGVDDWWLLFALSTVYAYFCIFLWGASSPYSNTLLNLEDKVEWND